MTGYCVIAVLCTVAGMLLGSALRGARERDICKRGCDYYKAVCRMQTLPDTQIDGDINVGI